MRKSVLVRQVLPSILGYVLLVLAAIGADFLFHRIGLGWIGRYFGISGSVLIAGSFAYSLRKRKILHRGSPKALLHPQRRELRQVPPQRRRGRGGGPMERK